jgi:serine/threonine protein kinase/tetratricopeptide (TPR) repeat protein
MTLPDSLGPIREAVGSRYEILREIGQGAFATVYLARDLRHDRDVAFKVLNADPDSETAETRFLREIRLLAKLQHPNILPLIDSGHVNQMLYYVMPFVRGESLRQRVQRERQLAIDAALSIARETADALECAHHQGIIHRDIKPENILLSEGHAIVADFGVARALDVAGVRQLTRTGMGGNPGTPAYMSPEQVMGDREMDGRSDIYSLGCMLYEMLSGRLPFSGRDGLVKRFTEAPPAPSSIRNDIPAALDALVLKSLARDPSARYQTAAQFARSLNNEWANESGANVGGHHTAAMDHNGNHKGHRAGSRKALLGLASAIVLLLLSGSMYLRSRNHVEHDDTARSTSLVAGIPTVAVLPFSSIDADANDEYFSEGMTDELAHALSRIPSVRVAARTSSYAFKGKSASVREIAGTLKVAGIIEGTVRRFGDRLRVTAALTSSEDGLVLWSGSYESQGSDVFQVQDSLTNAIVSAMVPALRGERASTVASTSRGTEDASAYDLYLRGRYFLEKRGSANLNRAIVYFKEAIATDSDFARAHAGLAMAYLVLPTYAPISPDSALLLSIQTASRALAIDSTLADANIAMGGGLMSQFKLTQSRRYFESAITREPANATAHFWYGLMFRLLGDVDGDLKELRRASELDPLSQVVGANFAYSYYAARRMPEAIAQGHRVLEIDSTAYPRIYTYIGLAYLFNGEPDSALLAFETEYRLTPTAPGVRGERTLGYAATGRWRDAGPLRAEIVRGAGATLDKLFSDVAFSDWDGAVSILEQMQDGGYLGVMNLSLGCSPIFDPLKANPRFVALVSRLRVHVCKPRGSWPILRRI